jgi:hypothetical protein
VEAVVDRSKLASIQEFSSRKALYNLNHALHPWMRFTVIWILTNLGKEKFVGFAFQQEGTSLFLRTFPRIKHPTIWIIVAIICGDCMGN